MLVQELVVSLCYDTASGDPTKLYSPANGGDITLLLQSLPALPSLRAAKISAIRRSVGPVDMCCMSHLEHLALACAELDLRAADGWDSTINHMGPRSLPVIAETTSLETVGFTDCATLATLIPCGSDAE